MWEFRRPTHSCLGASKSEERDDKKQTLKMMDMSSSGKANRDNIILEKRKKKYKVQSEKVWHSLVASCWPMIGVNRNEARN